MEKQEICENCGHVESHMNLFDNSIHSKCKHRNSNGNYDCDCEEFKRKDEDNQNGKTKI